MAGSISRRIAAAALPAAAQNYPERPIGNENDIRVKRLAGKIDRLLLHFHGTDGFFAAVMDRAR